MNLNSPNRRMRTRTSGGVGGVRQGEPAAPTRSSAAPGYTATDLNRHLLQPGWVPPPGQTVEEAARVPVRLALLPDHGPTGGFFDKTGVVPW